MDTVLNKLVNSLMPSDTYKIILFGSYANGTPNEHNDVDIMVIGVQGVFPPARNFFLKTGAETDNYPPLRGKFFIDK